MGNYLVPKKEREICVVDFRVVKSLFPGDNATGKCVHHHLGIVAISNSSGCLAILGIVTRDRFHP